MFDATKIARAAAWMNRLPRPLRERALSLLVGRIVPFVGTARLRVLAMSPQRVIAVADNRRRVQNHIGGVHAAAATLLGETVTGFVVAMNLPPGKLPLIKTMHLDFLKRMRGRLRAEAWLEEEQLKQMQTESRGSVEVPLTITDESGEQPIKAAMTWAWVPSR